MAQSHPVKYIVLLGDYGQGIRVEAQSLIRQLIEQEDVFVAALEEYEARNK